jgi:hypothetical protein
MKARRRKYSGAPGCAAPSDTKKGLSIPATGQNHSIGENLAGLQETEKTASLQQSPFRTSFDLLCCPYGET